MGGVARAKAQQQDPASEVGQQGGRPAGVTGREGPRAVGDTSGEGQESRALYLGSSDVGPYHWASRGLNEDARDEWGYIA